MTGAPYRIGVDIGGTFTDFVLLDTRDGSLRNGKLLTTPHAPEEAVLAGIRQMLDAHGIAPDEVQHVIHGTTLVANALIERRGVPTGLITTDGFRDVVEIGTELRHDTYDLFMRVPQPLVPRSRRIEVAERILPDGGVRVPLDDAAARAAARDLGASGVQAVAVCFLHAFRNPAHERRMAEILAEEAPGVTLCLSSDVVPEIGEYERASTTICNAYVLPVFQRYLTHLAEGLRGIGLTGPLYLMLSDGGTVGEETAARHPIRLVQSGPAGGVRATALLGGASGAADVLCFDMGGTTAKACLIEGGEPLRSLDFEVARVDRFRKGSGLPLKVPVIEMIEIGAGGGSIAQVDRLGLIQVGPESASSDPGPACYGLGGTRPTVTDADLVLGYLGAGSFLGGDMRLDVAAAERAIREHLADPLGLSVVEAAWALHETVNGNMAQAAAIHALEKARRIEGYAMVPIGGAGPVHAAQVCRKLGIARMIAPAGAGVASAFGFLASPISFAFVRGWVAPLATLDFAELAALVAGMEAEGRRMVAEAGVAPVAMRTTVIGALRYAGQGFQVEAEIPAAAIAQADRDGIRHAFEAAYLQQYGRTEPALPVEGVSWRVIVAGPTPALDLARGAGGGGVAETGTRPAWFPGQGFVETSVIDRTRLGPGDRVAGPALVEERESTLVLPPGSEAVCDASLNLVVTVVG
ncbi:hydantoinase/oxoprolinase family protein [Neoroseomonas oryzicola]|uniref:Hydantoinase/oxoprolinase family protein n=1 Tax=Neoroseomonas oryzicola TaxID=535904 RepID=A0A9X9WGE6_9PROT|nr:hydantoinase/oxoprolinase family protein [Neoroseomonas oryzicola]MBR0659406.1 hydantoinase/oxoprolinase family protein [Neoroseomonas oryzicola]NKE16307.1 hydantoinase/oxoprolinase family protein [Neoroseomonas oryzicola]